MTIKRISPFVELKWQIQGLVEINLPGREVEKRVQFAEALMQAVQKYFNGEHDSLYVELLIVAAEPEVKEPEAGQRKAIVRGVLLAIDLAMVSAQEDSRVDLIAAAAALG